MGQRANLVLKRKQYWHLYYDHWCANRLDVELFWGPRLAADFIEQRAPLRDRYDWLDDVWCEGGAVLDEDTQVLVWYGGEDIRYDVPLRRAFLDLMQSQWEGWEIRWAMGGIVELRAYVGLPAPRFLVSAPPEHGFSILTEYPEDNDTLLTVRQHGQCLVARVYGGEEALDVGPSQLAKLRGFTQARSLHWTGAMPTGGVHVDMDGQTLHYWCAKPAAGIEDRVQQSWRGWQTAWLKDHFDEQLRLAALDIQLPHRTVTDLQRNMVQYLRRCCTHQASNPAPELADRYEAAHVNPWTDVNRASVGTETDKRRLLDSLEAHLQR